MTERNNAKVRIESDGTPTGTRILADGKVLETTHVSFEIGIDGLAKATITMYVDQVDVVADVKQIVGVYRCTSCERSVTVEKVTCSACVPVKDPDSVGLLVERAK